MMSGMHVIGCWLKGSPLTFLWLKSPIDLVKFNPFTLPWIIGTPVFSILALSIGFSGLWSKDKGMHLSFCQSADRESPALAQMTCLSVMATTIAVAPAVTSVARAGRFSSSVLYLISSYIPGFSFINSSTWMNVYVKACPIFPSFKIFLLEKMSTKWAATNLETSPPPWPSKTPNSAMC